MQYDDLGWSDVVYRIRILDRASRELAGLDEPIRHRVIERINWLARNLDVVRPEALRGDLAGFHKLRVGDCRIIYEIIHVEQTIVIHAIGHRREIYRKR